MKISFIATVLNEKENIDKLLDSLLKQSMQPDEIVIVDAGSIDTTVSSIKNKALNIKGNTTFKILKKKGNRSVGRNEAIKNSTGDIIVCSDAGCILDKDWVKNIIKPFRDKKIDVVAGYYRGNGKNVFQKCLVPYVLVMPDKISPNSFLPATRSVAFRKSAWKSVGGFPEEFSDNEDYVFARKITEKGLKIEFEKNAVVYWMPRETLSEAFIMFYTFARGDIMAKILRPKVAIIFTRYLIGIILLVLFFQLNSYFILHALYFILIMYLIWAIFKNYKYVKDIRALLILPILQILSDVAVITGTIAGAIKLWVIQKTQ